MKNITIWLLTATAVLLSACQTSGTVNGKSYEAYGILNQESVKDPGIVYEPSARNVILGIVFIETIFVPVNVVGWNLWVPVRAATNQAVTH